MITRAKTRIAVHGTGRHFQRNVVAYLALFIALSGTAWAATTLPPDSVGTRQLQNEAVTGAKLANGAVTSSKVAQNSLTGAQINESTLGSVHNAAHATDADQLGGSPASAFQARVSGACSGANAIQSVNGDGTVVCQPTGTGTITGVSPDTGLTGGGTSGSIALGLDPNYRLPQSCASGQLVRWSGTAWGCSTPAGGTITGVTAGTDLTGGGSSGSVVINADETKLQHRLTQSCSSGIASVNQDGTGTCAQEGVVALDHNMSYGNDFNITLPGSNLKLDYDCQKSNTLPFVRFLNNATSTANLNWTYSNASSNSGGTTTVGGVGLNAGGSQSVLITRIEGQFIYSLPTQQQVTVSLHALNTGSGCEITGTAQYASG